MNNCKISSLVIALVLLVPCMAFALPGAHDPASGNGYACNTCHIAPASYGNTDATYATNVCLRCHSVTGIPTLSQVGKKSVNQFAPEDFADPFGYSSLPRGSKLQTSHKWFGSDTIPQAGAVAPVDTALNGLNKSTYFKGTLFCARCHNIHGTSDVQSTKSPYLRYPNDQDQLCMNCHRPRDTRDHTVGSHPVNVSYTSASVKARIVAGDFLATPVSNPANPTGQVKLVNSKIVCSTCHRMHNTDSRTATFDPFSSGQTFGQLSSSKGFLLRVDARGKTANDVNICTNCHAGMFAHDKGGQNVQCNDCHSGHVEYDSTLVIEERTPNVNLVRRFLQYSAAGRISKRILYRSTTTKEYFNASGNGVCQSCHNPPSDHLSGATPEPGHSDCASCHTHRDPAGSWSAGGGSCNACHGQPPTTAAAGGPTGKAAGYTAFDESTTPHASHAAGGGSNYQFACNECHKGNTHNSGGTFADVFVDKTGIKAGASAAYSSPNCSNVYCHSNGNGGYKAGQNPIAWNAAKFIGTGSECTTCHENTGITTGSHTKHVASPLTYGCATCHAATVSNNTTISNKAKHVNTLKEVQFSNVAPATGATCSVVACHSNGKGAAPITVPVWGTPATGACGACHLTGTSAPALATGSHTVHFGLIAGNDPAVECAKCHTYTTETAATHVNGVLAAEITTGCATNTCHGTIASPAWGANTANDSCTKCHGTGTGSVSVANRQVVAPSLPAGTDTGNVSANVKTGAHQTHILMSNGLSAVGTKDDRCQNCHGTLPVSSAHINSNSAPAFQGLATKSGAMSANYAGTNCSNTYCHNPAGTGGTLNAANAGTGTSPSWTNSAYIAEGTLKTLTNCNTCHKVPGEVGFTSSTDHSALTIASDCAGCHGHNGNTVGGAGQQHIDGIMYGNGSCDACHGYPPLTAAQFAARGGTYVNAKVEEYAGGGGHHSTHLLTTVAIGEGFTPCLPCHPNNFHNQGGGAVVRGNVNVNDAADAGYRFDSSRAKRYNTATLSCSNVSCHFQPTAAW